MLLPLAGSCVLEAITSAPLASLSVNYFFDHNHTCGLLNISAWYLGIDLLNLSYSENFNLKNF